MATDICIFRRVEKKYLLTEESYGALFQRIGDKLLPDEYGKSTVSNLYLDTPDYRLIRNSIDAVDYKEKLRLRAYGQAHGEDRVFLEIKKKYNSIVYKRRVAMCYRDAMAYLTLNKRPEDSQIMREIDYAMWFYHQPKPMVALFYERSAYFAKDLPNVRLTFDADIRYRTNELSLSGGSAGKCLLPPGRILMEIKTDGAMPLWLADALGDCAVFPTSFSKYGTAYADICREITENPKYKGEIIYA